MSKGQSGKKFGEGSNNLKFLQEIEAISKALYLDKTYPKTSIPSLPIPKPNLKDGNSPQKDQRSIWSWKALKAFRHIRNKRFNFCFSFHVHSIQGLPSNLNDLSLYVHWKRRDTMLMTCPARVFDGNAEFEEQLTYTCSVYGSRNGPHNSAKYEAKHFLFYVSILGNDELDLGKHRIDLTRLLPLTLEELDEENCSGKWTTSFSLSGKAKGAIMNVTFGYSIIENQSNMAKNGGKSRRTESVRCKSHNVSRSLEDMKPELFHSVNLLYLKLEEENLKRSIEYKVELDVKPNSNSAKENVESEWEVNELCTVEQMTDLPSKEEVKLEEGTELHSPLKEFGSQRDEILVNGSKESVKSNDRNVSESVTNDFLDMLEIEHYLLGLRSDSEPESPREQLLKQFEKETLANGYSSFFNFDFDEEPTQYGHAGSSSIIKYHKKKEFEGSPSKSLNLKEFEGLGPFVRTKTGGILRFTNPLLYSNIKSKGGLIMQASSPVIVPAEMGEGIMDILRRLASNGNENLSIQANKLMPLEDINGKTIQEIEWESAPKLEEPKRSEFVTLEDLVPLAMDKIEVLSIERFKIQSCTSNDDASSNIIGGLTDLSLTLDEWMKLDSGEIDDADEISQQISKILAAHHHARLKCEKVRGKSGNQSYGLMGNNITMTLMVQLHDPLRNYEPIGAPMLGLILAERVFVSLKPRIHKTEIIEFMNEADQSDEDEIPKFKITDVQVVNLKADIGKKKLLGSKTKRQCESRWSVANGMRKTNKHPLMKSLPISIR